MTVQVTNVRKFRQATVVPISPEGTHVASYRTLAVQFPKDIFSEVDVGTVWEVDGSLKSQKYTIQGWEHTEDLLVAKTANFVYLSGKALAFYLAHKIEGVGEVIARRVINTENIDEIITSQDVEALCQIKGVDKQRANALINFWPNIAMMKAISWVQNANINPRIGRQMFEVFGQKSIEVVSYNPFLLLSLGATWKEALSLSEYLGFRLDSPETLCATAEQAASNLKRATGDVVVDEKALCIAAYKLIKRKTPLKSLVDMALSRRVLIRVGNNGLVPTGMALIEDSVANSITQFIKRKPGDGSLKAEWERFHNELQPREALQRFESTLPFNLTDEQREAIIGSVMAPVACISGSAGTGKTTILKAILGVYRDVASGLIVKQVALSGRAAQRMAESTGHGACTIAKLIFDHTGRGRAALPDHLLLVVDEASMVDLLSMYRLCSILPEATRIIFVGDVAQLPPVGPGLIFHSLTRPNMPLPTFQLSQVKRQAPESGIHSFAMAIRNGDASILPPTQQALVDSTDASLETEMSLERAYSLWCQAGGREQTIILSPVHKGELGIDNINIHFQKREGGHRPLVKNPHIPHTEWRNKKGQWLFEGDPVMVNQNDYVLDVRNGEFGYIHEAWSEPNEEGSIGIVMLDNGPASLSVDLLEKLELAYAITVHKSQGSQWTNIIVTLPEEAIHMTDQALLYTGATRPQERLVIMGLQSTINAAVKKGNIALNRKVCLGGLITQATKNYAFT